MSLACFLACVAGYNDHMFDLQLIAVHSGYWSGYYSSRKPKPLKSIINKLIAARDKQKNPKQHADTVDVSAFLAAEQRFKNRISKQGSE